uniref:Odorant receptor n=1 Tax=Ceracris kiangsu TaxID=227354 RepID=A0A6M6DP96_CERKI|nr:odorant receptor 58 [Ceracris kiangsu]
MSVDEEQPGDELLRLVVSALRWGGLWRPPGSGLWYRLYQTAVLSVGPLLVAGVLLSAAHVARQAEVGGSALAVHVYYCTVLLSNTAKTAVFAACRNRLSHALAILAHCPRSERSKEMGVISRRKARLMFALPQVMVVLAVATHSVVPLLGTEDNGPSICSSLQAEDGLSTAGGCFSGRFPLELWYPTAAHSAPLYHIVYVLQLLAIYYTCHTAINVDLFFFAVTNHASSQLEELNNALCSMGSRRPAHHIPINRRRGSAESDHSLNGSRGDGPSWDTSEKNLVQVEHQKTMYQGLIRLIRLHQIITRAVTELEPVISYALFGPILTNILNICLHMLVLTTEHDNMGTNSKAFVGIVFNLIQNGLYCSFGETLTHQSDRLFISIYSSGWEDGYPKFEQAVAILLFQTRKPLQIKVAKLYTLSRRTFLQLLNNSYGLFNLLYQVKNPE